jgi:deoxyribose-phosphate aldolase
MNYLNKIDHTLLKNSATLADISIHCRDAVKMGAFSVCVNPAWVKYSADALKDEDVKVCTVIGFPLGASPAEVKAFETRKAIEDGADEIDMVINIGFAKSQMYGAIYEEILAVKDACGSVLLKVIVETSEFDATEKDMLYQVVGLVGVEYIKTSTGTTGKGATVEDVKRMVEIGDGRYKVKASGGVSDLVTVKAMVEAGADRIGTSGGLRILKEIEGEDVTNEAVANY